ncbi:MAG: hypothetical protein P8Z42_02585 [Anaerolineales bacterium]
MHYWPGDLGKPQPWDGKTFGRLKARGPAVSRAGVQRDLLPQLTLAAPPFIIPA